MQKIWKLKFKAFQESEFRKYLCNSNIPWPHVINQSLFQVWPFDISIHSNFLKKLWLPGDNFFWQSAHFFEFEENKLHHFLLCCVTYYNVMYWRSFTAQWSYCAANVPPILIAGIVFFLNTKGFAPLRCSFCLKGN